MNESLKERITRLAYDHAEREFDFANMSVTSVEQLRGHEESHGCCYQVRMKLSHSKKRIQELIADGRPQEAEIRRTFLEGDFVLRLTLTEEKVIATEWEEIDVC